MAVRRLIYYEGFNKNLKINNYEVSQIDYEMIDCCNAD